MKALELLSYLLKFQGKTKEAAPLYLEALAGYKATLGERHSRVLHIRMEILAF